MGETALVVTAPTTKQPADTPKYRRVTPEQRKVMRDLRKLDTPQTKIAEALGVSQSTVSKWLAELEDTTADATEYFRAKALPMAEKIVRKGRPSDLIKALQGVGVLEQEKSAGLVIQIGVKDSDVQIHLSPPSGREAERKPAESLTIQAGSDNRG